MRKMVGPWLTGSPNCLNKARLEAERNPEERLVPFFVRRSISRINADDRDERRLDVGVRDSAVIADDLLLRAGSKMPRYPQKPRINASALTKLLASQNSVCIRHDVVGITKVKTVRARRRSIRFETRTIIGGYESASIRGACKLYRISPMELGNIKCCAFHLFAHYGGPDGVQDPRKRRFPLSFQCAHQFRRLELLARQFNSCPDVFLSRTNTALKCLCKSATGNCRGSSCCQTTKNKPTPDWVYLLGSFTHLQ